MTTVFLVDDHELIRRGIREALVAVAGISVIGESGTVAGSLDAICASDPDVALLDVSLPDGDGIELCRDVVSAAPRTACLILTSYTDDEALCGAVLAGARGYLLKQIAGSDLVGSIRTVAAGSSILDAALVARVTSQLSPSSSDRRLASLSPRERGILDLIVLGRTNKEIGELLFLSDKTVRNYVSNLLSKLEMKHRTEAAVFAVQTEQAHRRRHDP